MAENRIAKIELKQFLRDKGYWETFVEIREQLKRDGMSPAKAWHVTAAKYEHKQGFPESYKSCITDEDRRIRDARPAHE